MKNSFKTILVTAVIALIFTLSLVGGYKFITGSNPEIKQRFDEYTDPIVEKINEKAGETNEPEPASDDEQPEEPVLSREQDDTQEPEEITDDEPYTYQEYVKRDSAAPTIYQTYGYIFNSEGKIIDDYRNARGSNLRFVRNIDGSEAVFTYNDKCLFVDADLNVKEICDECLFSGINFEGGYIYYLKRGESGHEAHIVDIANDTDHFIASGNDIFCVCISPDGRSIVYSYSSDRTTLHVKGIDTPEKIFKTDNANSAVSVSNDGETIFYYDKDGEDSSYYCLNHGKSVELGKKSIYKSYLDRECKQLIFKAEGGDITYYRAGDKKSRVLVKGERAFMNVGSAATQQQDIYMQEYIVDTDSFADVLMVTNENKCFCLRGSTPKADELTKGGLDRFCKATCVTQDGPCGIYVDGNDLHKLGYEDDKLVDKVIYHAEDFISDTVCSKDLSKIWVLSNKKIFYISEGASPVEVSDLSSNKIYYSLAYDHVDELCYYISDNDLWCVGETPDSNRSVMEDCSYLCNTFEYTNLVHAENSNKVSYIIIHQQPYRER